MSGFTALLRREWLEHRPAFVIAPLSLLAFFIVVSLLVLLVSGSAEISVQIMSEQVEGNDRVVRELESDSLTRLYEFDSLTDSELGARLDRLKAAAAVPFRLLFFVVLVFVLLGTILEERKDRTVLFWKSMPVSDLATIASKLIAPVWIAPLATVAVIFLGWLYLLLLLSGISLAEDLGSVWRLWALSGVFASLFQLLVGFAIQGLWALPIYGWLLLVSATATRLPLLWAVLPLLALFLLERLFLSSRHLRDFVMHHLEFAALPSWEKSSSLKTAATQTLSDQLSLLLTGELWLGVAVGVLALGGSWYFRQRNNEV